MKNQTITTGDARKVILETIIELKSGEMDISRGLAIAANMKVLNDSLQVEVNVAKLSLQAASVGKDFGEIMRLGQKPIFEGQLIDEDKEDE
jgi:hypothetical protein